MSDLIKEINEFFRLAQMDDVRDILDNIILTERQTTIFTMKYMKGYDIGFIADNVGCSQSVVNRELRKIRNKLSRYIGI